MLISACMHCGRCKALHAMGFSQPVSKHFHLVYGSYHICDEFNKASKLQRLSAAASWPSARHEETATACIAAKLPKQRARASNSSATPEQAVTAFCTRQQLTAYSSSATGGTSKPCMHNAVPNFDKQISDKQASDRQLSDKQAPDKQISQANFGLPLGLDYDASWCNVAFFQKQG